MLTCISKKAKVCTIFYSIRSKFGHYIDLLLVYLPPSLMFYVACGCGRSSRSITLFGMLSKAISHISDIVNTAQ